MEFVRFPKLLQFEWDENNENKILAKHGIRKAEAEQAVFNRHFLWFDEKHSNQERRYNLLGISDTGKILFITFIIRKDKIRIISARLADRRERSTYGKEIEKNTQI